MTAARIHELCGAYILKAITASESIVLLTLAASIAETNSVLDIVLGNCIETKETRRKGQKTFKHLHDYLMYVLKNENQLHLLQAKVTIQLCLILIMFSHTINPNIFFRLLK